MKKLKLPLLIYIIITQQIISNSKYINTGILPNYPYRIHLENILEKYDESNGGSIYSMLKNADPQTIQSLGEDIGKIILFGEKAIDSIRNMGISLYSDIKSLVGYSKDALFSTIGFIKNYYPQIAAPAAAAAGVVVVGVLTKSKIDDLNKYNDGIVYEIQNLIKDEKYKRIIRDKIGIYLQKVIEKGISKLNLTKYIEDFLNTDNILEKLDKKFKKKIDSLNFILLGNTGVGKSTLLNKILDLNSKDKGAYVNPDLFLPTTMEFKKYRNENKKGIELIDSRGIESNENYNTKYFMGNFTNYFEKIRKESNSNFIYGILFICEIDTISEIDTLNYLKNISNNKIPLKLLYSKGKDDNQVKKINKTIASTIGIKPYFLKTTSKKDYDKNLNSFLKDLFEELDEKKLKDIYQYYYSLDVFYHFQLIMKKNNAEQDIFTKPLEKKINPTDYIIHNLEFDLNFFLPKQNINLEGINKDIKEIYNSFISELNKDFKNITYENYCLKEYENRKFFDKFKEYFISNHLPNDIIAQGVSQTINNLILNIFLITVKQQFFKKPIELRYYPDFTNIKNIIEKNFINNKENTSYSYYLVRTIVIFIIAFVAYVIYQYYKNRKRKEKEELIELENVPDIYH